MNASRKSHCLFAQLHQATGIDAAAVLHGLLNTAGRRLLGLVLVVGDVCLCVVAAVLVPREPRRRPTPTADGDSTALDPIDLTPYSDFPRVECEVGGASPAPIDVNPPCQAATGHDPEFMTPGHKTRLPCVSGSLPLPEQSSDWTPVHGQESPEATPGAFPAAPPLLSYRPVKRDFGKQRPMTPRRPRDSHAGSPKAVRSKPVMMASAAQRTPAVDPDKMTVAALRKLLSSRGVKGTRTMKRAELLALLGEVEAVA